MRGLRTWIIYFSRSPRMETLGWVVSVGRKPNSLWGDFIQKFHRALVILEWGSFRSSTWASSFSVGSVSAVAGGRVQQFSLWPVPFNSLSWWPIFYLSSFWVRYICKPILIFIIMLSLFQFYVVWDCSVSCLLFYMAIFCWINVYFTANCGIQYFSAF